MSHNNIIQALNRAISCTPISAFEDLSAIPFEKMTKHDYITRQDVSKTKVHLKNYSALLGFCLLMLATISWWYATNYNTDSMITLDVNPSIQIEINQKNYIVSVTALNNDAKIVLEGNHFKGQKLEDAIAVLLKSMIEHNYLTQNKKTILLSVLNKDSKKADTIINQTKKSVENTLNAQDIHPIIMTQLIDTSDFEIKLAKQYHISLGKLKMIQSVVSKNPQLDLETLSRMTIQQLYDLIKENAIDDVNDHTGDLDINK